MKLKQLYKTYTLDELVDKYKKTHDELAFSVLYQRILLLIGRLLSKINEGIEDIEDFVFYFNERLTKLIDDFDDEKGKFVTYVCAAIKNDYINYTLYKTRKRRKPIAVYNIYDYEYKLYYYVDIYTDYRVLDLKLILSQLTNRQREILYLHYNEGFSLREIAEFYDTSVYFIKKDLRYAEETIKTKLQ